MTPQDFAIKLVNNNALLEHICNLMYRWEDECRYEDFADYAKAMFKYVSYVADEEIKMIRGTEQPFGILFEFKGIKLHLFVKSNDSANWLAIKSIN